MMSCATLSGSITLGRARLGSLMNTIGPAQSDWMSAFPLRTETVTTLYVARGKVSILHPVSCLESHDFRLYDHPILTIIVLSLLPGITMIMIINITGVRSNQDQMGLVKVV